MHEKIEKKLFRLLKKAFILNWIINFCDAALIWI